MIKVLRNWEFIVIREDKMLKTDIYFSKSDEKPIETTPTIVENKENDKSIEELKTLLKNANIKFFAWAKYEALLEKCKDNNLI